MDTTEVLLDEEHEAIRDEVLFNELQMEHLGFQPLDFIDAVINAVNLAVHDEMKAVEQRIQDIALPPTYDADGKIAFRQDDEIAQSMFSMETLLSLHVDREWENFEIYMLKIFSIPVGLFVPMVTQDDRAVFLGSDDDLAELEAQTKALRERVYALRHLESVVQSRIARKKQNIEALEAARVLFEAIKADPAVDIGGLARRRFVSDIPAPSRHPEWAFTEQETVRAIGLKDATDSTKPVLDKNLVYAFATDYAAYTALSHLSHETG